MQKAPVIKKETLLNYLVYVDDNVDILKLVKYLAMHSSGALKLTYSARNKAEWNIEE
jgi:hypothetical protein